MTPFVYYYLGGGWGRFVSVAAAPLYFFLCGNTVICLFKGALSVRPVGVRPADDGGGGGGGQGAGPGGPPQLPQSVRQEHRRQGRQDRRPAPRGESRHSLSNSETRDYTNESTRKRATTGTPVRGRRAANHVTPSLALHGPIMTHNDL
eukprot:9341358-Pyramimonas_sp.AAC.1